MLNVLIAAVFGLLGGLAHDVIQNKRILQKSGTRNGDIFLGFWAGLFLGGIAGLLVGLVLVPSETWEMAAFAGLSAGISLKGLAEAAATSPPPKDFA